MRFIANLSGHDMLEYSEACERNREPILGILTDVFAASRLVLEIGSGTGQHAVFLSSKLPHLQWLPTDRPDSVPALRARLALEAPINVRAALALDVTDDPWPEELPGGEIDAVFSANTLHIMSWRTVERFFAQLGAVTAADSHLCIYGPFRYGGDFTSPSNARFDHWIKARDPDSGVRDFVAVDALAAAQGFHLVADHAMPANNQLIVWQKKS